MPPNTSPERRKALDERLESVMLMGRMTMALQNAIAKEFGVADRTVRAHCQQINEKWAEEASQQERGIERADFLQRLRAAQTAARVGEKFSSLANMMATEARILGLFVDRQRVEVVGGLTVSPAIQKIPDADLDREIELLESQRSGKVITLRSLESGVEEAEADR
jgi:hypothetical protein